MTLDFPWITPAGETLLQRLREHPQAPRYTHPGVNRLTPAGLRQVTRYGQRLDQEPPRWRPGQPPVWLADWVAACYAEVPFFRRHGPPPRAFEDLPIVERHELQQEPWAFVPDHQPLDGLLVYQTSGTTGHPLDILTHADTLALYVPLLQAALARQGMALPAGPERVRLALVCYQQQTYTFAATLAGLGQSGFVKLNLHPAEWRDPADRSAFLADLNPDVLTGDPVAFAELMRLPAVLTPRALVSTAQTLLPGLQQALQERFQCPVLDVYSLNESGPVAVAGPGGFQLLQPQLYVEILDETGAVCAPGQRGQVVVTGGFNPYLPLLRYATGDYARLEWQGDEPRLRDLEGRPAVRFRNRAGQWVNSIDVSVALRPLALARYALHQAADGSLHLRWQSAGAVDVHVRRALEGLFGAAQPLILEDWAPVSGKAVQYTTDLAAPSDP